MPFVSLCRNRLFLPQNEISYYSAERPSVVKKNLFLQKQILSVISVFLHKLFVKVAAFLLSTERQQLFFG